MSDRAIGKLPSPMEFPDVIQPVTPKDYPALWDAFGLGGGKRNGAEIRYERLSAQIAILTGHEHAVDRHGHPFSREEWKASLFKSLNHLNNELKLGMDHQMIDVLTLCYTALQESPRYGGDPVIEAKKGENTAVHSLHTMLQALRVYQKALEEKPELAQNIDFFRSFQMTCLIMAVHDLGEMFGEAGSLAQVASTGNWGVKDKTAYERSVFHYGVRLAIQTVIDKKGTEKDFFDKIDGIKAGINIQNEGINKTDQQMEQEVSHLLKGDIPLSMRAKKLFGFMEGNWEWIEDPASSRYPFLGYLAATCERVQGTRHINRMMTSSQSPCIQTDGRMEMMVTHRLTPGNRLLVNSDYTEGHLGWLCDHVDPESSFEAAVAKHALAWTYESVVDFYKGGPEAFFMDPGFNELKLDKNGSAFSPAQVSRRLYEIASAKKVADIEAGAIEKRCAPLSETFQAAVIPIGRLAAKRDDIVAMYEKAIATGYFPTVVSVDGKRRGEVLIRDLPAALTEIPQDHDESGYPKGIVKKIESIRAALK